MPSRRATKAAKAAAAAAVSRPSPPPPPPSSDWQAFGSLLYATAATIAIASQATDVAPWTLLLLGPFPVLLLFAFRDRAATTDPATRASRSRWSLVYVALVSLLITAMAADVAQWTMPLWTPIPMLIASGFQNAKAKAS